MALCTHVSSLVAFKRQTVALQHLCIYQLEALPELLLFLSPDGVTPGVCLNQKYEC
jgi:hypothetical protein